MSKNYREKRQYRCTYREREKIREAEAIRRRPVTGRPTSKSGDDAAEHGECGRDLAQRDECVLRVNSWLLPPNGSGFSCAKQR